MQEIEDRVNGYTLVREDALQNIIQNQKAYISEMAHHANILGGTPLHDRETRTSRSIEISGIKQRIEYAKHVLEEIEKT